MTISTTIIKNSYSGNGSTTAFTYNFKITDDDDIQVIIRSATGAETVKSKGTHYNVAGVGNNSGTVTFTSGNIPASGETVVLRRSTTQTQTMDLIDNDPMSADTIETAHDKTIAINQELQEQLDRSLKISRTNTMTSTEFTTSATDRANKVLSFNASGELDIAQELGTFKGNWAASTAYVVRDIVKDTSTNNIFIATTAHTSSGSQPLTTNTDSAKWSLIVDAASATTSASGASTSATAAANSATAAASSASTASTQASNASTSASTASTQATNASNSATAAASSATSAAASFDSFDDRYLGAKSSNPSTDNDGDALVTGAIYFNTSSNQIFSWTGSAWVAIKPSSSEQTNINTLAASAVVTDMSLLATTDVIADMALLATSDVISDMNTLATSAIVADMALLATTDVIADMALLANADVISDMNTLATSDIVSDLNTLATSDIVSDLNTLATSDIVSDINTLATSDIVSDLNTLATSDIVSDINTLATSDIVSDLNLLATSDFVSDLNTLATSTNVTNIANLNASGVLTNIANLNASGVLTNIANLNASGVITNINNVGGSIANVNTAATNLSGINSFAERYRVGSSDPGSNNDAGDLFYNTNANALKYFNGSNFVTIVAGSLTDIVQDSSPQLGGDLASNGNDIVFADNDKAIFGAGSDLEIYHDGSNSFIKDGGTGSLKIQGASTIDLVNGDNTEYLAQFKHNGSVDLYYDSGKKFETTNTGATITGAVAVDTISEKTSANGVTIDGLNIKDSKLVTSNSVVAANITADAIDGSKIADNAINSEHYTDGSIDHVHLSADAVDGDNIANDSINSEHYVDGSIDNAHLAADAVDGSKIADNAINSEHYTDGSIDTAHVGDDQITYAKIQNVSATNRILGRDSSGAGVIEEITAANVRTMLNVADGANNYSHPNHSGEVTSSSDGATVIADNIVDEANLKVSNSPVNGYMLTAQSGNTGGLTWAAQPSSGGMTLISSTNLANISAATSYRISVNMSGYAIMYLSLGRIATSSTGLMPDFKLGFNNDSTGANYMFFRKNADQAQNKGDLSHDDNQFYMNGSGFLGFTSNSAQGIFVYAPAATDRYKTMSFTSMGVAHGYSTGLKIFGGGQWRNNSAITECTFTATQNLNHGVIDIYGIK